MTVSATHVSPASVALREVAAEDPNRAAIEIDERQISYAELNEQADRLAQRLVKEVGADDRIGLRANGTHELAVGYTGIQRAGMIPVTVDPTAPPERVQTIVADVEPALLLSDVEGDDALHLPAPVFHPLTFGAEMDALPIDRERGELASIVYTSGSTGAPKGIMMGRDQMNAVLARLPEYQAPFDSRVGGLVAGTVSYIEQLVSSALYMRGTIVAYEIRRHGLAGLASWLESSEVVAIAMVPTVLRHVLPALSPEQKFSSLRVVTLSGETVTWEDVAGLRRRLAPDAVIINGFGLTETYGISTFVIPSDMPLGKGPLPAGTVSTTLDVSVRDPQGRQLPTGERGEIVVRGSALALGYWRRPDLTRATFRELDDGRREVRTGDSGRLLADGTLQHFGRLDHLVKISGNRVELGEVEHALRQIDGIDAAAAAPYTDDTQNTRLAACVVPTRDGLIDARALRAALTRRLPGYMVPDRIAIVDTLPQLPGGKVDRARIAELREAGAPDRVAPEAAVSELERSLAEIWREVLQVEQIDRHDDFFALGGDSMRAARMFLELDRRLGIDRPVSLLAEAPTIASLALMLDDDESVWDALLAFQTDGTRPPLFVVHDGEGGLLNARRLVAELGPDQPIYGLRAEAMSGRPLAQQSITELAASYVRKIQALYPDGPYLLYGASLGGILSLEMARQLIDADQDLPLVAMGDTRLGQGRSILRLARSEPVARHLRQLQALDMAERFQHLFSLARRALSRRARGELSASRAETLILDRAMQDGEPVPAAHRAGYARHVYAGLAFGYQPGPPFPERVLLLRTGGPGRYPDRGWGPVLGSRLEIADVPGTHADLGRELSGPYVGPLLSRALTGMAPADPTTRP